jgi:hypothetical protein
LSFISLDEFASLDARRTRWTGALQATAPHSGGECPRRDCVRLRAGDKMGRRRFAFDRPTRCLDDDGIEALRADVRARCSMSSRPSGVGRQRTRKNRRKKENEPAHPSVPGLPRLRVRACRETRTGAVHAATNCPGEGWRRLQLILTWAVGCVVAAE